MRIRKLELNLYFSDKEIEYISLDTIIDMIEVLATHINQSQPIKKLSKEPVKRILRQRIEKKKEYTASKNIWFDE